MVLRVRRSAVSWGRNGSDRPTDTLSKRKRQPWTLEANRGNTRWNPLSTLYVTPANTEPELDGKWDLKRSDGGAIPIRDGQGTVPALKAALQSCCSTCASDARNRQTAHVRPALSLRPQLVAIIGCFSRKAPLSFLFKRLLSCLVPLGPQKSLGPPLSPIPLEGLHSRLTRRWSRSRQHSSVTLTPPAFLSRASRSSPMASTASLDCSIDRQHSSLA